MSRRRANRRQNYGRRQHELRERRERIVFSSELLEISGSAGGGELGADRLRRPGPDYESTQESAA
jgi:hypothetical protein